MVKVLAVVALMTVAQLLPSCGNDARTGDGGTGSRAQVIGWIEEKRQRHYEFFPYMVVINGQEYGVPYDFYLEARVGDLVKYDGEKWTFVRRAGR
jgi:hypothetical protein